MYDDDEKELVLVKIFLLIFAQKPIHPWMVDDNTNTKEGNKVKLQISGCDCWKWSGG